MDEEEEEEEKEERKEELLGMSEDDSEPGILPITNNEAPRISPRRTVELEDPDFKIEMWKNYMR